MASQNKNDPQLCAKGCGFFGTAENKNMCSKCYAADLKEQMMAQLESLKLVEQLNDSVIKSSSSLDDEQPSASSTTETTIRRRCVCCNKKVGLLGFNCKCGLVFCGEHRYPEKHSCSFNLNFKVAAKEVLAKQNPLCKTDKMESRI